MPNIATRGPARKSSHSIYVIKDVRACWESSPAAVPRSAPQHWRALALGEIELARRRHLEAGDLLIGQAVIDKAGGGVVIWLCSSPRMPLNQKLLCRCWFRILNCLNIRGVRNSSLYSYGSVLYTYCGLFRRFD